MERRTKMAMDIRRRLPHGGYNTRSTTPYWMRDLQNKRAQPEEDFDLGLSFTIHGGDGIDPPSRSTFSERTYFLVWWLEPGKENWAPFPAPGKPIDPLWDRIWTQRFDRHVWPGFIYVEVMRRRDKWAAGTSSGIATVIEKGREKVVAPETPGAVVYGIESVSRAKIPLPKPGKKRSGRFGLVQNDGPRLIGQGHISVTVELVKLPS